MHLDADADADADVDAEVGFEDVVAGGAGPDQMAEGKGTDQVATASGVLVPVLVHEKLVVAGEESIVHPAGAAVGSAAVRNRACSSPSLYSCSWASSEILQAVVGSGRAEAVEEVAKGPGNLGAWEVGQGDHQDPVVVEVGRNSGRY